MRVFFLLLSQHKVFEKITSKKWLCQCFFLVKSTVSLREDSKVKEVSLLEVTRVSFMCVPVSQVFDYVVLW